MATILVVDDNALNRSVLTTLLAYRGHRMVEAADGHEAIERTLVERPDLVITDILMPNMDGYQLVQKLKALGDRKPRQIIFYSATYLEEEAQALAQACGVSRVICKPAEPEHILKVVDEALAREQDIAPPNPKAFHQDDAIRVLNNKLYRKVVEVEELNAALEKRVAERTHTLEEANRALKDEILERHKAEDDAAQSRDERLKMKGEFLSHVSHELRSPLAVVHQFTTILLDGLAGSLSTSQKEYLEISLRNVNQLKYMIDDLLEASRADTAKLAVRRSTVSIADLVTQIARSQAAAAKEKIITLKVESPDQIPPVYADPARVLQVLTNLLDNAFKFSPSNTTVTLRTEVFADDPAFVLVSIADNGCGIDPEHAGRVFDRLYQVKNTNSTSRSGLGLGLYICKELISLQGGAIWVNPKRTAGTTFHFTLPIFTIQALIAPVVIKDGKFASAISLLTVEVRPRTKGQTERVRERVLRQIQQILERSMLSDLDVLLPMQSRADVDLFHIVARTDEHGSDVMVSRFREQLSGSKELKRADVDYSISSQVICATDEFMKLSPDRFITWLAAGIKERLKIKISEGVEHNERQENNVGRR